MNQNNTETDDDDKRGSQYNYGVMQGGVYQTRHEAVGAAAILNRGKSIKIHQLVVIPNLIGISEALRDMGQNLRPRTGALTELIEEYDTEQDQ